jgi:hypothetical protein
VFNDGGDLVFGPPLTELLALLLLLLLLAVELLDDDGRMRLKKHRIRLDSPSPMADRYNSTIGIPNKAYSKAAIRPHWVFGEIPPYPEIERKQSIYNPILCLCMCSSPSHRCKRCFLEYIPGTQEIFVYFHSTPADFAAQSPPHQAQTYKFARNENNKTKRNYNSLEVISYGTCARPKLQFYFT